MDWLTRIYCRMVRALIHNNIRTWRGEYCSHRAYLTDWPRWVRCQTTVASDMMDMKLAHFDLIAIFVLVVERGQQMFCFRIGRKDYLLFSMHINGNRRANINDACLHLYRQIVDIKQILESGYIIFCLIEIKTKQRFKLTFSAVLDFHIYNDK